MSFQEQDLDRLERVVRERENIRWKIKLLDRIEELGNDTFLGNQERNQILIDCLEQLLKGE